MDVNFSQEELQTTTDEPLEAIASRDKNAQLYIDYEGKLHRISDLQKVNYFMSIVQPLEPSSFSLHQSLHKEIQFCALVLRRVYNFSAWPGRRLERCNTNDSLAPLRY